MQKLFLSLFTLCSVTALAQPAVNCHRQLGPTAREFEDFIPQTVNQTFVRNADAGVQRVFERLGTRVLGIGLDARSTQVRFNCPAHMHWNVEREAYQCEGVYTPPRTFNIHTEAGDYTAQINGRTGDLNRTLYLRNTTATAVTNTSVFDALGRYTSYRCAFANKNTFMSARHSYEVIRTDTGAYVGVLEVRTEVDARSAAQEMVFPYEP